MDECNTCSDVINSKQLTRTRPSPRNLSVPSRDACQAYRELAKIHHPDKVQGEEEKLKSEKIFQEVAEAYEVLGDDELRAK